MFCSLLRLRISSPVAPTKAPTSPSSQVPDGSRSQSQGIADVLFACTELAEWSNFMVQAHTCPYY